MKWLLILVISLLLPSVANAYEAVPNGYTNQEFYGIMSIKRQGYWDTRTACARSDDLRPHQFADACDTYTFDELHGEPRCTIWLPNVDGSDWARESDAHAYRLEQAKCVAKQDGKPWW